MAVVNLFTSTGDFSPDVSTGNSTGGGVINLSTSTGDFSPDVSTGNSTGGGVINLFANVPKPAPQVQAPQPVKVQEKPKGILDTIGTFVSDKLNQYISPGTRATLKSIQENIPYNAQYIKENIQRDIIPQKDKIVPAAIEYAKGTLDSAIKTIKGAGKLDITYLAYRAAQGKPVTPKEHLDDLLKFGGDALNLTWRINKDAPIWGAGINSWVGIRKLAEGKISGQELANYPIEGINKQPGVGSALTDNIQTAQAIDTVFMATMFLAPFAKKGINKLNVNTEIFLKRIERLELKPNATMAEVSQAVRTKTKQNPDAFTMNPTPEGMKARTEITDALNAFKEAGILDKNYAAAYEFLTKKLGIPIPKTVESVIPKQITEKAGVPSKGTVQKLNIPNLDKATNTKIEVLNKQDVASPVKEGLVRVYQASPAGKPTDFVFKSPEELANFKNNATSESEQFRFIDVPPKEIVPVEGKPGVYKIAMTTAEQAASISVKPEPQQKGTVVPKDQSKNVLPEKFIQFLEDNKKPERRVLSTKETQYIQEVIAEKLSQVRQTAESPQDLGKGVTKLYEDIVSRAKDDKVVLSSLRTAISKEMYTLAGSTGGGYKADYANLQTMKKDPEIGPVLDKMETYVAQLDTKLTTAREVFPQKIVKEKPPQEITKSVSGTPGPVGTGKLRESRAYQRLKEELEVSNPDIFEKIKDDPKLLYNRVNQQFDFENAAKLVEDSPEKAYRIAMGIEAPPEGQREASVSLVLADRALGENNLDLWKDLETSRSLRQTRRGQELVAERGRFDMNSPHHFVQELLSRRLEKVGGKITTELKKELLSQKKDKVLSKKEAAMGMIDKQTKELSQKIKVEKRKQALTIDVQKFIDDLIC